jgi:diguanylate cyclase (GGDEF)-like protein/PAS domain S-box-containing protein
VSTEHESRAVRVLLVEDDEDDFVLTRDLLADSRRTTFSLDWVSAYDDAVREMRREAHDIYLIDFRLGTHDGLEILREAKSWGCAGPIILLTGQSDTDIDVAAMKAGAADYLVKGQVDAKLLERSIRYSLEQSRTLDALRESEERYALSARGANDGLWVWDVRENSVYYSPRWKSMLGYDDDEIEDSPDEWLSRVHPDDAELLRSALQLHREGGSPHFESEYRIRCKGGDVRWMLARGLAVHDAEGIASRIAGSQTDITAQKIALERLLHDAFHDALTELPNRALFMDRLSRALEASRRHPESGFAVLFLDLDRFKVINDSLGHTFGDQLLLSVAQRLALSVRASDTVARLGGDEFTILLEDLEQMTEAVRTAQRIQESLAAPFRIDDHEVFTSVSIGIALSVTGYANPEEVLRDADIAMYRAKSRGKARHEVFDKTMHDRAVRLLQVETDLRRAIDRGELRVHYQPIVSLVTGRISGFEALVRWQRGDELVPAYEIIPLAEETGLIMQIGDWVLREALRQSEDWRRKMPGQQPLHVHVNLSPRQFLQPNLVEQIERSLGDTDADPTLLHLEVTESVLIENAEAAGELLRSLRSARVGLSLDDFGTGYSSLSTLQQFPFDTLKIDRAFVGTNGNANRNDEIVRTIANLARVLGMEVTVEGVESGDQVSRMRALGIDYAQGFFFSPPVDAISATAMMATTFR